MENARDERGGEDEISTSVESEDEVGCDCVSRWDGSEDEGGVRRLRGVMSELRGFDTVVAKYERGEEEADDEGVNV